MLQDLGHTPIGRRAPVTTLRELAKWREEEGIVCRAEGCHRPPRGQGAYCDKHQQAFRRTGHPNGKALRWSELGDREAIEAYIKHTRNPAVLAIRQFLRGRLEAAPCGIPRFGDLDLVLSKELDDDGHHRRGALLGIA